MINTSNSKYTSGLIEKLSLDETIFVQKIDALYKSLLSSSVANIVIAFTLVLMLREVIDNKILIIWFTALSLINVVRIASYLLYSKIEKNLKQYYFWGKIFFGLMLATAMAWACVGIWLLPVNDSIYHYLPILVLIGVSAGAITSLGYHLRYMFIYFNFLLLPIFISEISQNTYLSNLISALIILFTVFALSNGKRFYNTFVENIKLHYDLEKNHQEIIDSKNAAVAANSAKSSFISMISHELRTPLNAIMGFSQLLRMSDGPNLNNEQLENTQGILDSGKHLLSLIEELLDLSKIESHKLKLNIEGVSLANVLKESILILNPVALGYQIKLINNVENIYLVQADSKRLKQIMRLNTIMKKVL